MFEIDTARPFRKVEVEQPEFKFQKDNIVEQYSKRQKISTRFVLTQLDMKANRHD